MRFSRLILLGFAISFVGSVSHSWAAKAPSAEGQDAVDKAEGRCTDASQGIDANMNECVYTALGDRDAALNQAYKQVMAHMSEAYRVDLRNAQRAWIDYRDKECRFENMAGESEPGTLDYMMDQQCIADFDKKRTIEFQQTLDNEKSHPEDYQ